uniref:MOSC domain-containing protein n=1 Tax=Dunaliella tertiolecta TaxID=3047 RepID=A0A7S3R986_DUNTE
MTRFRPNLVMKGSPAWEEDSCRTVSVQSVDNGVLELISVKPCSRCKVPTIDPETAEAGDEPLDTLHTFRNGGSLGWSKKSWKHAVFFGTNLVVTPEVRMDICLTCSGGLLSFAYVVLLHMLANARLQVTA